jgi:hypothetical protein
MFRPLVWFSEFGTKALADKDDKRPESDHRHSGQVKHDDRGNAVWHWAADTARTAMASTSQLLRKLDLTGLSLEESDQQEKVEEPRPPKAEARTATTAAKPRSGVDSVGSGFDPYSTNAGTAKRARPAITRPKATPAVVRPIVAAPKPQPEPQRSWWQRLLRRD